MACRHLGQIVPPFEVVRGLEIPPGGVDVLGLRFEAIPVFESPEKLPGDEVTILHFRAEGRHVVFLGDLGHGLTEEELRPIRGADVLMIPAGGPPTIDYPLIPGLVDAIGPRIIIPMHYKTAGIDLDIRPVEGFLDALTGRRVEGVGGPSVAVGAQSGIILLAASRLPG